MNATPTTALPTRITVDNANDVHQQLQQLTDTQDGVSVDLYAVVHCDSAGIAALIEIQAAQLAKGRRVNFQNPSRQLQDLAQFLKVDELLFKT